MRVSPHPKISGNQWKGFIGAFGGWLLDGFEVSIFGLVMAPALTELLPNSGYEANTATLGYFGQLGVAIFLVGWGCSFVWGPIAERLGRVPALMYSIIVYAVFTFAAGFSQNIWQLFVFRFLAAIGIGGEWAMAGTLVAETMPERVRPRFGGLLHSGVYIGTLLGSIVYYVIGIDLGWRWMFYLGLLPALFVIYIRHSTKESTRWVSVSRGTRKMAYSAFLIKILRSPYRKRTWINTLLLFISLTGFWAGSQYLGTAIVTLAVQQGLRTEAPRLAAQGLALLSVFTIVGCVMVAPVASRIGRRSTLALLFALMIAGIAGGFGWGYYAV